MAKDEPDAKQSVSPSKPKVDQEKSNESDKTTPAAVDNVTVAQCSEAATASESSPPVSDDTKSETLTESEKNQTDDEKVNRESKDEANTGEKPVGTEPKAKSPTAAS